MIITKKRILSYIYSNFLMYIRAFLCCLGVFIGFKCGVVGTIVGTVMFVSNLSQMINKTYLLNCYQENDIKILKGVLNFDNYSVITAKEEIFIPEFNLMKYQDGDEVYLFIFGVKPTVLLKQKEVKLDKELSKLVQN